MVPPTYDHARKAGNPGDLFKHAVLAHVVAGLTRPGAPFLYVESHAGRPLYRLREGGEWLRGAGALPAPPTGGPLAPYWRHALGECTPRPGVHYPGSAELVHRLVSGAEGRLSMRLWDHQPAVAEALRRHFSAAGVEVATADGYRGVAGVEAADLVLVDPVALEREPIVSLLRRLRARDIPFLCWVPRRGDGQGREEEVSALFRRVMVAQYGVESVRWEEGWREGTCGCYMVTAPRLREAAGAAAGAVRAAMGWWV